MTDSVTRTPYEELFLKAHGEDIYYLHQSIAEYTVYYELWRLGHVDLASVEGAREEMLLHCELLPGMINDFGIPTCSVK